MTHAELLRRDAELAMREGGMYYSGQYLSSMAYVAESLEAENTKLRELVRDLWPHVRHRSRMCGECELPCDTSDECLLYEPMRQRMRELGIEVDG